MRGSTSSPGMQPGPGALRRSKSSKSANGDPRDISKQSSRSGKSGRHNRVEIAVLKPPQVDIRKQLVRQENAPVLADYVDMIEALGKQVSFVEQRWFCVLICIETTCCLIALGLEAEFACKRNCNEKDGVFQWRLVEIIFSAVMVAEIVCGVFMMGPRLYFIGRPRKGPISGEGAFHCVDALIVSARVLDVFVLAPVGFTSGLKLFSAFRIYHVGWYLSQFQLVGMFRELWLIMSGLLDTLKTVSWVVLILAFVLWVFACFLTITVNDGTVYDYRGRLWGQEELWGSVPQTLFTLFQVLTKDSSYSKVIWPLVEQKWTFIIVFLFFFVICSLALMNTVVGAVVESTLRSARLNEEKNERDRQRTDMQLMNSLESIFNDADTDGNGELDRDELHAMLRQLHVKKVVSMLNMRTRDFHGLFTILDSETKGVVKTERFFRGCARFRGNAMARDLDMLGHDFVRQSELMDEKIYKVRLCNDVISDIVDIIERTDKEVIRYEGDANDPVTEARRVREYVSAATRLRTVHHVESEDELSDTSEKIHVPMRPSDIRRMNEEGYRPLKTPAPPPIPQNLGEQSPPEKDPDHLLEEAIRLYESSPGLYQAPVSPGMGGCDREHHRDAVEVVDRWSPTGRPSTKAWN